MWKTKCKNCGCINSIRFGKVEGIKYSPGTFFDLAFCRDCGLYFMDIENTGYQAMQQYYPDEYKPHNPILQSSELRKKAMQYFRKRVFGRKKYYRSKVRNIIQSFLAKAYNKLAYRSIPEFSYIGKLLDIGCGTGEYLSMMNEIGWQVQGVEPGQKAASFAQGRRLEVTQTHFEAAVFQDNSFDVITMWHVLEHFQNPKQVLTKARKFLKSKGVLFLGIPNYNSFDRKMFKTFWNGFEVPLHLYHFTPDSIYKLMQSTGFECVRITHTIRPADMVSSMENFYQSKIMNRKNRVRKLLFYLVSILITSIVSVAGRSSIIVVEAKKKEG